MMGYHKDEKLTNEKFLKINKDLSILFTGDICKIDKDGFIYFYKRKDDIFKSKNYRVSKSLIEKELKAINGIDDAIVIPPEKKFKYTFFIKSKLKEFLIVKKIKQNLDFYKIPDKIVKIKEVPINDRGKVDLKSLKNED